MNKGVSGNMQKGYIKDGYDYMLETYEYNALKEVAPQILGERTLGDHQGEGWQRTTVVNSGTWRRTAPAEGFVPSQPVDGYTAYARVFDYTQSASFTNDAVKDMAKMKNMLKDVAGGWGQSGVETREEFYASIFNNGGLTAGNWIFNGTVPSGAWTDSSGNLCYDSIEFFNLSNNTRSSTGGGTYYNAFSSNLTPANLKTIYLHGMGTNNRRENDTRMRLDFNILLVPTNLMLTGEEILTSKLVAYETTNTNNVMGNKLVMIPWSYLTDTDAWFLGCRGKGVEMIKRQQPTFDFIQDKLNRCWWALAEMRMGVLVYNWRYWLGSNLSSS